MDRGGKRRNEMNLKPYHIHLAFAVLILWAYIGSAHLAAKIPSQSVVIWIGFVLAAILLFRTEKSITKELRV